MDSGERGESILEKDANADNHHSLLFQRQIPYLAKKRHDLPKQIFE